MSGNPFTILLQMFYEPGAAFRALRERSHGWLPLLLLAGLSAAVMVWYAATADPQWLDASLTARHPEMNAQQLAATGKMMHGGVAMAVFAVTGVLGTVAMFALSALYLLLAGRFIGAEIGFGKWFAFSAWTRVPGLLVVLLMALQVATGHGQVALEDLNMVSLNFLFLHLAAPHPWFGFANALDLSAVWSTALTIIGLRAWTDRPLATCVSVAVLPMLVIFGLWAAKIIAFS